MARRREHTLEQIKEMIILATENIILNEGLEALTARKIALDIGYTVGSIYMVFENMQELMMHVNARALQQLSLYLQNGLEETSSEKRLKQLAKNYLQFALANANRWRILFATQNLGKSAWPIWYTQYIDSVFVPIEQSIAHLNPETDNQQLSFAAKSFWAGMHGVCLLTVNGYFHNQAIENSEAALDFFVDNFVQGLKP